MPDGYSQTTTHFEACAYVPGFFKELSPTLMEFALLDSGIAGPDTQAPFTYCELGYGQGVTLNLLAAANPHGTFYGTDFNRKHYTNATALAETGGLNNLNLFADSFETFSARPLPQFDIIVLHGIYSWVDDPCRELLLRFITDRLKPCGLVYVSYNALPGWTDLMPLRRLLMDYARATEGLFDTAEEHAAEALARATKIAKTQSGYFADRPVALRELERLNQQPPGYLAHEYLVPDMQAFYAGNVIQTFECHGFGYSGSVACLSNAAHTLATAETPGIMPEAATPAQQETIRDFQQGSRFRQDIYSRGGTRLSEEAAAARFMNTALFPRMTPTEAANRFSGDPATKILQTMHSHVWASAFSGSNTVQDLIEQLGVHPDHYVTFLSLLQTAIGYGALYPCRVPRDTPRPPAMAFNQALLTHRPDGGKTIDHLASPVLGTAVPVEPETLAGLRTSTRKSVQSQAAQETISLLRLLGCLV